MDKLINEISTIIRRYGQSIVTDNRFVNILRDLYPDRDNFEKFKIISDLISQGTIANLLKVKKNDLGAFVEKQSLQYSKTNKVDKEDISEILFAFAIAAKCITRSEYNHYKKPIKPNNPNNPVPHQPNPVKRQYDYELKDVFTLILAFIGLCATPFVYLGLLSNGWWPFWAIVVVAVLHLFTIVPGSIVINGFNENLKKQNPVMVGSFCTIAVCGALFLAFAPFIIHWTYDWFNLEHSYWFGTSFHKEYSWASDDKLDLGYESPSILTFVLGFFCSLVEVALAMTNDGVNNHTSFQIFKRDAQSFIKGVTMASLAIAFLTIICFLIPRIAQSNFEKRVRAEKESYNLEVQKVAVLKDSRSSKTMDFSFKDFFMGQGFEQCQAIINSSSYTDNGVRDLTYGSLKIDPINYNSVVDTLLCATTEWDNKEATIYLYFNSNKLIGIKFSVNQELDSLVSMYSKKYGKPEHLPLSGNNQSYRISISDGVNDRYTWTYKNGVVQIEDDYYRCEVTYLDRTAETMLQKFEAAKEAERQRQAQEAEQARKRTEELQRQKALEESKRQENNHKKAISEI